MELGHTLLSADSPRSKASACEALVKVGPLQLKPSVGRASGEDVRGTSDKPDRTESGRSLLDTLRDFWSSLDTLIGILLAALLLPLLLGPLVAVYQFIQAGDYGTAAAIGVLATACYVVAGRAVARGEFGPGTAATVLGIAAVMAFVAFRLRQ